MLVRAQSADFLHQPASKYLDLVYGRYTLLAAKGLELAQQGVAVVVLDT